MEEQVTTAVEARRPKKIAPLLVLLLIAVVAAAAAYFVIGKLTPVDPASYIPKEATFAIMLDVTPTADKKAASEFITAMLKEAGMEFKQSDISMLNKQFGLDLEKDILSHLNGTGAFAVLTEMAGATPEMAAVIGVKSEGEAKDMVSTIEKALKKQNISFEKIEISGQKCLKIRPQVQVEVIETPFGAPEVVIYASALGKTLTLTNSQSAFEKIVDVSKGKPNLLSDKNYTSIRKESPAVFASTYYSSGNFYKLVGPLLQLASAMAPPGTADTIREGIETNIATVCTAEATANGLTFTTRGVTKDSGITGKKMTIDKLVEGVTKDAAIVAALGNFTDLWSQYKKQIEKNSYAKSEMDKLFAQAQFGLGLDLNKGILDRIKSLQMCYVPAEQTKSQAFPGALNLIAKVDKPDVMSDSMQKVHLAMAIVGKINVKPADFAGQSGFIAPVDKIGTTYSDVVVGDKLILGFGESGAVKSTVSSAHSNSAGLTSDRSFKLVKKHLPKEAEFLMYGDVKKIMSVFAAGLSKEDRKSIEAVTSKIGCFGTAGTSTPSSFEMLTVVPFQK